MGTNAARIRTIPPPSIAAALAQHAVVSDRAVLVGNRAGVVGWANQAWTEMTGFPLEATLGKPIAHFLGEADIELELVDFVGQHYLEGRPCTIEFPFETFDERSIWVHLEVQPIRNEIGEIVEFVAVATDETERRAQDLAATRPGGGDPTPPAKSPTHPTRADHGARADGFEGAMLGEQARLACERHLRSPLARIDFDLALDEAPLPVSCSPLLLSELIRQLLESAIEGIGEGWGTVTVISGRTEAGRGHVSKAYPLVARSPELARATWHFLEIHDSGTALDPMEPGAALDTDDRDSRRRRLAVTSELARLLGGALGIDSAPGCGTQALLLLPPAPRTASE